MLSPVVRFGVPLDALLAGLPLAAGGCGSSDRSPPAAQVDRVMSGALADGPPGRASLDELDRRVPLSIARWQLHVNICVPRLGECESLAGEQGRTPAVRSREPIATREACDAAGGRFLPRLFGWMVHADVLESDDPATVWAAPHNHQHPS